MALQTLLAEGNGVAQGETISTRAAGQVNLRVGSGNHSSKLRWLTDWATLAPPATAGGTLVLAVATFASIRRTPRTAQRLDPAPGCLAAIAAAR